MEKITWSQLKDAFYKHNEEKGIKSQFEDKEALVGVIVYKQSNFNEEYSEESRSYEVTSDNKYFLPNMNGKSLFGNSLDGQDKMVRLDWYN